MKFERPGAWETTLVTNPQMRPRKSVNTKTNGTPDNVQSVNDTHVMKQRSVPI